MRSSLVELLRILHTVRTSVHIVNVYVRHSHWLTYSRKFTVHDRRRVRAFAAKTV